MPHLSAGQAVLQADRMLVLQIVIALYVRRVVKASILSGIEVEC